VVTVMGRMQEDVSEGLDLNNRSAYRLDKGSVVAVPGSVYQWNAECDPKANKVPNIPRN